MAAVVPYQRAEPDESSIRIGAGPSSIDTFTPLANLGNWLRGTGAQIVAGNSPNYSVADAATRVFRYRTRPRSSAIQRVWVFQLRTSATVVVSATVKSPASSGTARVYTVPNGREMRAPFVYTQTLAAKTSTEAEVNFEITAAGGAIEVESIACYEQTRCALNKDSTDLGVDMETIRGGQPIRGANYESIEGIHDLVTGGADPRRVAIYHWGVPEEGAETRTTASYSAIFGLASPILAPLTNSGETTAVAGKVLASVYAKVAGGAGGQVRLTTDGSGVTKVINVTGTSFGWSSTEIIACDVDDMSASDGRRSTRFDGLQVEIQGDGTNQLSLAGVSVWVDTVA